MNQTLARPETAAPKTEPRTEHFDVLIVGAGISGVGGAYHLTQQCPGTSFVVLESQDSFGGTWITHKYPGIRSDSDLYTFGYRFKPWTGKPIATAAEILSYMGEVIAENDLGRHIRYGHQIASASWSSKDKRWTIEAVRGGSGERVRFTATFLWMCQGYYRHSEGYTPEWQGMDQYKGQIVHPQTWPEDLDYKGKQVLVIGSGATAATLVPAIAGDCEHVTLLQRSPTFFVTGRNANVVADMLRELKIDETWIHEIVRRKILHDQATITRRSFTEPEVLKQELLSGVRAYLGPDYDIDTHFTPRYRPWRQRIAFIPDGDLFQGIRSGKASVVTDEIDRFTEKGILLKSGKELQADIIVTATGFNLNVMGDIQFSVDGKPVDFGSSFYYRNCMFSNVPNMAGVFGYINASWTLRVDIIGEYITRLLKQMDAYGAVAATPVLPADAALEPDDVFSDFSSGYLERGKDMMPKNAASLPWRLNQDYRQDKKDMRQAPIDDGVLAFTRAKELVGG